MNSELSHILMSSYFSHFFRTGTWRKYMLFAFSASHVFNGAPLYGNEAVRACLAKTENILAKKTVSERAQMSLSSFETMGVAEVVA